MTKIGPSFASELAAQGLRDGISWDTGAGVLSFMPSVTAAQQTTANSVLAAHDPTKISPRHFTGSQFMTALVDLGIKNFWDQAAAASNKPVDVWYFHALSPNQFFLETNAKLNRLCARAMSIGAAAVPPVTFTMASVVDKAMTE